MTVLLEQPELPPARNAVPDAVRPASGAALGPHARAAIDGLRRRIRRYVIVEGLAATVAALVLVGMVALLVDRYAELSREARLAWTEALAAVGGGMLGWRLFRRVAAPLSDQALAARLEKQFPQLRDSLSSAVFFTSDVAAAGERSPKLVAQATALAERRAAELDLADAFNPWPRTAAVGLAAALLVAVAAFGLMRPDLLGAWAQRQFLLRATPWPRDTRLSIDGFASGAAKVARGDDLTVVVRAATAGVVPERVHLSYRTAPGLRGRAIMVRDGRADPTRDAEQRFTHIFPALLTDLEFDIRGGDGRIAGLRVEVVEPPTLVSTTLRCQFPEYLKQPPQDLDARGHVDVPMGTRIEVLARANKPLQGVEAEDSSRLDQARVQLTPEGDGHGFRWQRGAVDQDQVWQFRLHDADGITNRRPIRLAVTALPDAPPTLGVRLRGVGSSVTARARIPFAGQVRDDHHVARVWRTLTQDGSPQPLIEEEIALPDQPTRESVDVQATLSLATLQLAVGQKLALVIKAADECDLSGQPQVGASEVFRFEIVAPEALAAILENRELNLRRRFEQILSEVEQTADDLTALGDKLDAEPPAEPAPPESADNRQPSAELMALRNLQGARKNADETRGVWQAFGLLLDEYTLNDIANPQRMSRLQDGIVAPLAALAEDGFGRFVTELDSLHAALSPSSSAAAPVQPAAAALPAAQAQCQAVSRQMHQILEQMLELETFNEAVDKLRSIIAAQERLNRQTEAERKKQSKRALLED